MKSFKQYLKEKKNEDGELYWYAIMSDTIPNCSSHVAVEQYYKEHPFVIFVQTTEEIGDNANDYFTDYTIFNTELYMKSNKSEHKPPQEMYDHYENLEYYILFVRNNITHKDDIRDVLKEFYDILYNKNGISLQLEKEYFKKFDF